MSDKITVGIHTLGCRVNMYESCAIAEMLTQRGCEVVKNGKCDFHIVNTCAVTAESSRKSRQLVRRCAANGKVLVIGCASQIDPAFADIPNVIYVGGNREKGRVVNRICDGAQDAVENAVKSMDNAEYERLCLSGTDELFSECRAFIKIQDGCNGKCTYCIIPKCRGKVRSRPIEEVIDEAERLITNGYREIILTGIEVGAYNHAPLADLICRVSELEGLKRLRLGSLSPNVVSDSFLKKVSDAKCFMPHIHLSLQSCNDRVLKDMMRPYRKKEIYDRVEAIRRYIPNCAISADIIVGFPGETEQEFLETVDALNELQIFHVHSFPYSEREGTIAASMSNSVPKSVRGERNSRLIESCAQTKRRLLDDCIGKSCSVLIEKIVDGFAFGHTEQFYEAKFDAEDHKVGSIVSINISSHNDEILCGAYDRSEEHL